MDAALSLVPAALQLLGAAARSGALEEQGTENRALRRAWSWSRSVELLVGRLQLDPLGRQLLRRKLLESCCRLQAVLPGAAELRGTELRSCRSILLQLLLHNRHLPRGALQALLLDPPGGHCPVRGPRGICGRRVQLRAACRLLEAAEVLQDPGADLKVPDPDVPVPVPDVPVPGPGADADVQGELLLQQLDAVRAAAAAAEQLCDSVLEDGTGPAGRCWRVVAAALLSSSSSSWSQRLLLDRLLRRPGQMQQMCCSLPAALLQDVSRTQPRFAEAYGGVLQHWASEMDFSLRDGDWVHQNRVVSFHRLTQHFLGLFEACPELRPRVEEELEALRLRDGDFGVRGLSVWADLLTAFKH